MSLLGSFRWFGHLGELDFLVTGVIPPATNYLLFEDGVSRLILEDGSGFLLLE